MRILIISDAWEPQVNGVVRTYQNISRELRDMGHDVEIIGPNRFRSCPMPGYAEIRLSLFAKKKLWSMMDAADADIIHIAVEGPLGWVARQYCIQHELPFSTTFHTQFPDYVAGRVPFFKGAVRALAIKYVRAFHAPAQKTFVATQSLEDQLRSWGFRQELVQLTRGVDFGIFHNGPRTLFADAPKPVLLYAGRVSSEKNIEAFLDLDTPGTKIVVGHGPDLEKLKRQYPKAVFAGLQTGQALGDHYRSADVFVFPSKTDTFGMVLIEAMACGLPIAGYDVTGPRDIVTDAMLGVVHDNLATALKRALLAPGTREMREAYARHTYNWRAVAEIFIKE